MAGGELTELIYQDPLCDFKLVVWFTVLVNHWKMWLAPAVWRRYQKAELLDAEEIAVLNDYIL